MTKGAILKVKATELIFQYQSFFFSNSNKFGIKNCFKHNKNDNWDNLGKGHFV